MDWSWLAKVDNPIALFAVIAFLFIGGVVLVWRLSAQQTEKLIDKFIEKSDSQNSKLVTVVEKNTEAATRQAIALESLTAAQHRLADVVDSKWRNGEAS